MKDDLADMRVASLEDDYKAKVNIQPLVSWIAIVLIHIDIDTRA